MGRLGRILTVIMLAAVCRADWPALQQFQETVSRTEFDTLLTNVYCPQGALEGYLAYGSNAVTVYSTPDKTNALFSLRFGSDARLRPGKLKRIVLDPGHIGGEWARMEERYFVRGQDRPVQEAVLNLTVARLLKARLEQLGCDVFLTKNNLQPVTDKRPEDFRAQAAQEIARLNPFENFPALEREAALLDAVRKRQEQLFYRSAEIAGRAQLVNDRFRPDLTLCIHFNAVEWNEHHDLVEDNRLVVFVQGNYLADELVTEAQKQRLFCKLLEGSHAVELPVAESIANALAKAAKLPPVQYAAGGNAVRVGANPYIYARNLAANRLINGPVVFLEPYYMSNKIVYQRLQLGDYDGERTLAGHTYRSIYREYTDAVVEGLSPFIATR